MPPHRPSQRLPRSRRVAEQAARRRNRSLRALAGKATELGLVPGLCVENLRTAPNLDRGRRDEEFEAAFAKIPELLTEHEATFSRIDLIRAVATAHVGTSADPAHLMPRVDQLIASGRIVAIRKDQLKEPVYSTPEMVRLERETIDLARELANRRWHGPDFGSLQEKAAAVGLSSDQLAALNTLSEEQALSLLEGKAGTAKTYSLKPLVSQLKEDGHRVIAAAASWRTAEMLAQELQAKPAPSIRGSPLPALAAASSIPRRCSSLTR